MKLKSWYVIGIPLLYAAIGAVWILVSDTLLSNLAGSLHLLSQFQTYKGWGYVLVTAAILWWLLRRYDRAARNALESERMARQEAQDSESRFRHLFLNHPHPMWVYDLETLAFLEVNDVAIARYGYSRDEFMRMRLTDIRPKADVAALLENVAAERPTLQFSGQWRHRLKDGAIIYVDITSHELEHQGRRAALVIAQDVTQRRQMEAEIQRYIQRLEALRAGDLAISSSLDLQVALEVILDQTLGQLEVDAAGILLLNSAAQTLDYAAGRGFRSSAIRETHLKLGSGSAGRAAQERQVVLIPDLCADPGSLERWLDMHDEGFVSYVGAPLIAKDQVKGVLEIFQRAPLEPDGGWLEFLETLARQAAIALDNAGLVEQLQRSNQELALAYEATIVGWSRALDLRDKETEGHTQRVADLSQQLARHMGVDEVGLLNMRRGALLHDIGKMGVPDNILLKPGPLTEEEWGVMRRHPALAYEMLAPISYLRQALDIPYCHHERWDGSGYPRCLSGEQIPLAARIFSVIDVWDALTSDRPYRPAWTQARAWEYIQEQAGQAFDPLVVRAFDRMTVE